MRPTGLELSRSPPVDEKRAARARERVSSPEYETGTLVPWSGSPSIRTRWAASHAFAGCGFRVATVVGMIANGMTAAEVVDALAPLVAEDVAAALRVAADAVADREIPLQPTA